MESEGPSDPQKDKVVEIQANDTTSPRSFVTTLPISLFSSGAGVLLILLSFHKVKYNSILKSKTLFLFLKYVNTKHYFYK